MKEIANEYNKGKTESYSCWLHGYMVDSFVQNFKSLNLNIHLF